MATNYPGSLDTSTQQPSPSSSTEMDDSGFEHDVVHTNHSGAIIAVETKVGTGSSTPVASSVLGGTGSGTSAWTTTPAVSGLTVSGDVAVDTDTLFVDVSEDRVGVNRSSPNFPLHAYGATVDTIVGVESGDGGAYIGFIDSNSTGNSYDRRIGAVGDDLRFQTGATDRMTIQADGQVGIGTTTPFAPLQVFHSTTDTVTRFGSGDNGVYISFYDSGSTNETNARIGAYNDTLIFQTAGSDQMVIKSDGDVGIGTTSPGATLHANSGTADTVAVFESSDTGAYIGMKDDTSGSNLHVAVAAIGNDLALRSGNDNTVRIKGDTQRVGIGTTDPQRVLEVADNVPAIRLTDDNNAGVYHEILGDGASLSIEADDNNQASSSSINFKVDGSQKATITSDGRLGIGTSSPSLPLHVATGGADHGILVVSTDSVARINMQDNSSTDAYAVGVGATGNALSLFAASAERVRVADDGDVGIGTTSPSARLHVDAGTTNLVGHFSSTDANALLTLADNSTTGVNYVGIKAVGDKLMLRSNNTDQVEIATDGTATFEGVVRVANGSTSAPSLSFDNDSNTGFYITGNGGVIRFVGNGVEGGYLWNSGIRTLDGSAATPSTSFTSDSNTGMYRKAADTIGFATGGTERAYIDTQHIYVTSTDSSFVAVDPPTGTGNDAEWVSVFGVYLLRRNSSTAAEKLKIQTDLEGYLTPDMVDSVVPKMWTRDHAPDYPEIGPIADDMDAISPFLGSKGTNANGEQVLTGIDRNAYLSLLVLAVKDLRTRVVELENA